MANSTFQGSVDQNPRIAPSANTVVAVVTVKSILPPTGAPVAGIGRLFGFLLDESGSMTGEKWNSAKMAASSAIKALPDDAEFFVIFGGNDARVFIPLQQATSENKNRAAAMVAAAGNDGGTYFGKWLTAATSIFKQRPQAIKRLIFLTDGENGDDVTPALRSAKGLYEVLAMGVGNGYKPDELRKIVQELGGLVDGKQNAAELIAVFRAFVDETSKLVMKNVPLQLWTPVGARIAKMEQTVPQILDLTAKLQAGPNARTQVLDTGNWGEESREYKVVVTFDAAAIGQIGQEKLAARLSLMVDNTPQEIGKVMAIWDDNEMNTAIIHPKVAQVTGQVELAKHIQEGIAAYNAGDTETATRALQKAYQLNKETGEDEGTRKLLKTVVEVVDEEKGTVRLKSNVNKSDTLDLDTQSTRTRRTK